MQIQNLAIGAVMSNIILHLNQTFGKMYILALWNVVI